MKDHIYTLLIGIIFIIAVFSVAYLIDHYSFFGKANKVCEENGYDFAYGIVEEKDERYTLCTNEIDKKFSSVHRYGWLGSSEKFNIE